MDWIERRENTFVSHLQRLHLQLAFATTKDQLAKAMETIAWFSNRQQCLVVYAASIIQQNKPSNKYLYVCMIIHSQSTTKLMSTKPWGLSHKSLIFPLFWPETSKPFEIRMCKPENKSRSYTLVCFRTHSAGTEPAWDEVGHRPQLAFKFFLIIILKKLYFICYLWKIPHLNCKI